jgi:uncharacterized protein YutE (UPF0331/DUF86 family)
MDRQLIAEKLESLRRCVDRLAAKCPTSAAALAADLDAQDIVALNLQRAVQLCVDIASHMIAESRLPAPASMGETFDGLTKLGILPADLALRMRRAVGLRSIAVHNYAEIDWAIVHQVCSTRLDDFRSFARAVLTSLA